MLSNNYVVIQGWMCNELELKGTDLLVYALIYGFSQDGESAFHGSRNYIANTFNISRPTVDKALQNLVDKQYIIKYETEDFNAPNVYAVNIQVVKKLYMGSKETLQGGSKETLLYNTNKQTKEKESNSKELLQNFQFGKQKPKKENLYTTCSSLIYAKTDNKEVQKVLFDWLNMLLEKYKSSGRVLYTNVFKGKLNMLDKFDEKDWKEIIEHNLQKGYEGFYPISTYNNGIKSESGARYVPRMTEEDYRQEAETLLELERKGVQVRF